MTPTLSNACKPPPGSEPPTVEQLLEESTYVVYAEVLELETISGERRAKVKVLEQFKGAPLDNIGAARTSCSPHVMPGGRGIYFLDAAGHGSLLSYPYGMSESEILKRLRALGYDKSRVFK